MKPRPALFVNLAVLDLPRSMEFFGKLGFEYNRKFCDENAACMIVNDNAFVMLLRRSFFRTFTDKELCETQTHTESVFAISCETRTGVELLVNRAFELGAVRAKPAVDHGFMYSWSFYDLDGHHWEVLWLDPREAAA